MRSYVKWVRKYAVRIPKDTPQFSAEEEIGLARRIRSGDEKARETLTLGSLPLAMKIARKYKWMDGLEDAFQEACIGLMKAVDTYDPDRLNPRNNGSYRFSSYAHAVIRNHLIRVFTSYRYTSRDKFKVLYPEMRPTIENHEIVLTQEEVSKEVTRVVNTLPEK